LVARSSLVAPVTLGSLFDAGAKQIMIKLDLDTFRRVPFTRACQSKLWHCVLGSIKLLSAH